MSRELNVPGNVNRNKQAHYLSGSWESLGGWVLLALYEDLLT